MSESKRQYTKIYLDFIESETFDNLSGNALKLYLRLRRYTCRSRSNHSLCDFYIKGFLAVSGYLSQYADAFNVSKSSISRWLKELEEAKFIVTYYKAEKGRRSPNIWILGRVLHVEGSQYGIDIFFADHDALAQEPNEKAAKVFDQSKGEVTLAKMTASANFAVALTVAPMQQCVPPMQQSMEHTVAPMQPSNREDLIDKSNIVPAHSTSVLPPADLSWVNKQELEYVDIDEEVTRQKWQIPETPEQEMFLMACRAKWFKSGQKSKVKALLKAYNAGDILEDRVYEECARSIENISDLGKRRLPPLPRSWHKWRVEQAQEHRWSVSGFIKALLNRDALMQHCQYHMKGKSLGKMENGVYIIDIPEGGPM